MNSTVRDFKVTLTVGQVLDLVNNGRDTLAVKAFLFDLISQNGNVEVPPKAVPPFVPQPPRPQALPKAQPLVQEEEPHNKYALAATEEDEETEGEEEETPVAMNAAVASLLNRSNSRKTSTYSDSKVAAPEEEVDEDDEDGEGEFNPPPPPPQRRPSATPARTGGRRVSTPSFLSGEDDQDRLRNIQRRVTNEAGPLAHLIK